MGLKRFCMEYNELQYWVAFKHIHGIGPVHFKKLIDNFPSLSHAWDTGISELLSLGFEEKLAERIIQEKKKITPSQILEEIYSQDIKVITLQDENYPKLLREISFAPTLLFYKGNIQTKNALAIVGTRKISPYGKDITHEFSYHLSRNGYIIVSGLALGADTIAHTAALKASGVTWAVLGSGIDDTSIYPSSNRTLAFNIIASGGAVFSEYPPKTPPMKMNFPQRNRIISGLSLGTLITEAPEKSGALITAYFALEQNREVFAIPGSIFSRNVSGNHKLIKLGAKLVTSIDDILDTFNIARKTPSLSEHKSFSDEEKLLIQCMKNEPLHIDEIIRQSELGAQKIHSLITILELRGDIKNVGNGMYRKV